LPLHSIGKRDGRHEPVFDPVGRNKRTVWMVNTQPYAGSHFATFPEALIEPCILAGSRPGDLVFDPFVGSGTVGAVSERLMRRWVGTDLAYQHLSKKRTRQRGLRLEGEAAS
jgi:site-specific DNA-methyltransferase (cytosine-N4-specific)